MKKGMSALVTIVLGIVVIMVILFAFGRPLYNYVEENIFGNEHIETITQREGGGGLSVESEGPRTIEITGQGGLVQLMLAQETIACWDLFSRRDFNDIVCAKFEIKPELVGEITEEAYRHTLQDLLTILNRKELESLSATWNIGKITKTTKEFYLCADNDMTNEIIFTFNSESGDCS